MTDAHGQPFEIATLRCQAWWAVPALINVISIGCLPAMRTFYIANNVVLAPIFGHLNDARALRTLQDLFPDRRVVGINCEPWYGAWEQSTA